MPLRAKTRALTRAGFLVALGFALSYVEHLVALPLPVGVKLGLANIVTLFALCLGSKRMALAVLVGRCLLVTLVFGQVSGLLFSLSGGLCAFAGMALCLRGYGKSFSLAGISMVGAAAHHIGQIGCAVLYLQTGAILSYLPLLLLLSIPTGWLTGMAASWVVRRLRHLWII